MRAFVVLCLVAVACADKLGYNYHPVGHSDSGLSFGPGGSSGYQSGGLGGSVGGSHGLGGSDFGSSGLGGSGLGSSSGLGGSGLGGSDFGGSSLGSSAPGVIGSGIGAPHDGASYAPQAELEKEFFTFTANEDDFAVPHVENQIANSAKKNLRVIFIKGPENHGLEKAALALAKHAAEQKTAIYVLNKQADISDLSHKLNNVHSDVNHKPEVHFVKYRTHEDAINAQKAIQSQYDSLGGHSQSHDGGVAPVLNFASKAPVASHGSSGNHGSPGSFGSSGPVGSFGSSGQSAPSSSYIPPSAPSSTYLPSFIVRY